VFVHNCVKLYGVVSLGGSTYSFWEVKFTYMRKDWGNDRPITVATHHHHSDMIYDWEITKSFAGFLQYLVIRWVPEHFVEVDAGFLATVIHNTAMIIKRRGYTTTAWKGHQKTSFGISYRLQKLWFVFGTGVGVASAISVWKFRSLFWKSRWPSTPTKNQPLYRTKYSLTQNHNHFVSYCTI